MVIEVVFEGVCFRDGSSAEFVTGNSVFVDTPTLIVFDGVWDAFADLLGDRVFEYEFEDEFEAVGVCENDFDGVFVFVVEIVEELEIDGVLLGDDVNEILFEYELDGVFDNDLVSVGVTLDDSLIVLVGVPVDVRVSVAVADCVAECERECVDVVELVSEGVLDPDMVLEFVVVLELLGVIVLETDNVFEFVVVLEAEGVLEFVGGKVPETDIVIEFVVVFVGNGVLEWRTVGATVGDCEIALVEFDTVFVWETLLVLFDFVIDSELWIIVGDNLIDVDGVFVGVTEVHPLQLPLVGSLNVG